MYETSIDPSGRVVLVVSLRQLALPAVELSVLLQINWTPPVAEESVRSSPLVIVLSSSVRNSWAKSHLLDSNVFFASRSALDILDGL